MVRMTWTKTRLLAWPRGCCILSELGYDSQRGKVTVLSSQKNSSFPLPWRLVLY
jgi:hypothetical protein